MYDRGETEPKKRNNMCAFLIFQVMWRRVCRLSCITCHRRHFLLLMDLFLMLQFSNGYDFKLGLLLPWNTTDYDAYPFLGVRSIGAAPLAERWINSSGVLGTGNTLEFILADTTCSSINAAGRAVELHLDETVDAFVGPPCESPCETVADLTTYWGIPMTSWFCATITDGESVNDIDAHPHPTLARTYPTYHHLARTVPVTLETFGWSTFSIISPVSGRMGDLAREIDLLMDTLDKKSPVAMETYRKPLTLDDATRILEDVSEVSRIIWLLVPGKTSGDGDQQTFMLAAHRLGMTGDHGFAFVVVELFPDPGFERPWQPVLSEYSNDTVLGGEGKKKAEDILKEAYEIVLMITMRLPAEGGLEEFMDDVIEVMNNHPYNIDVPQPSVMSAYLYDALLLYAHALNISMATQSPPLNGLSVGSLMRGNVSFKGMTGKVVINAYGSRMSDYSLMDLQVHHVHNDSRFVEVGSIQDTGSSFEMTVPMTIDWPGTDQPLDAPKCGFNGEQCFAGGIIAAIVLAVVFMIIVVILIPILRIRYQRYMKGSDWLIDRTDITFIPVHDSGGLFPSSYCIQSHSASVSRHSIVTGKNAEKLTAGKTTTTTTAAHFALATFNSQTVIMRKVSVNDFNLNKAIKKELKEMRWLVHDNVNRFLGLCFPTDNNDIFHHVSEYCPKGSLKRVLENLDFNLDLSFKASFIRDLARGMQFIHASEIKSHGLLSSSTCYVDSRWVLKVSGFGLLSFNILRESIMKEKDAETKFSKMLWTAPELLRKEMLPTKGSPKGDVYSFGIILQEIVTRNSPYHLSTYTSREIIRRVIRRDEPPCRPKINEDEFVSSDVSTIFTEIHELMRACWEELPEDRPDFTTVRSKMRLIQKGRKELDILDNMLSKMEKYTENLEKVVADRTGQLLEEKKKTDALLFRMLPEVVAEELKKGRSFPGEFYEHVTIYFSDIVGFTDLSSQSSPMQVVDLLNDLYTCFDAVLEVFDVYKVETIGDAYMVVSGLPKRNGNRHAGEIASVALELLIAVKQFRIRHKPDHQLQIRIGINTGPVAAGVVGLTMPRFCLFGDTVNTASRMESNSLPQKIHISGETAAVLKELGGFMVEKRGVVKIKGKGMMTTYWLMGKENEIIARRPSVDALMNKKYSIDTVVSQDSLLTPSQRISEVFDPSDNFLIDASFDSCKATPRPSPIPERRGSYGDRSMRSLTPDDRRTRTPPSIPSIPMTRSTLTADSSLKEYVVRTGREELVRTSRTMSDWSETSSRKNTSNTVTEEPLKVFTHSRKVNADDEQSIQPQREIMSLLAEADLIPPADCRLGGFVNPVMDPRGEILDEPFSDTSDKHEVTSQLSPTASSDSSNQRRPQRISSTSAKVQINNNNNRTPNRRRAAVTAKTGGHKPKSSESVA